MENQVMPFAGGGQLGAGPVMGNQPMHQDAMVSLGMLLDHAVKRTYTDLIILSEVLPSKTDMERKVEIVKWAKSTRMIFVRLLALVKWAATSTKVDKCMHIMEVLGQQSWMFSNTADELARFWANDLVQARLPSFSVYTAIDVLVNKAYNLPTCMRDKIVPLEPIGPTDKRRTLERLNQIILFRLVSSEVPRAFDKPRIKNGRVRFRAPHEFEVTLTLMSDHLCTPWRLLNTKFLVADPGVGDNKPLVHPKQGQLMHQYLQNHLLDSDKPLVELYNDIHCFCLSLQLEVLQYQAHKLIRSQVKDYLRVEEYSVGRHLLLSYWRYTSKFEERKEATSVMRLKISVDESDLYSPLKVEHEPRLRSGAPDTLRHLAGDQLSMERLLTQTIMYRATAKLEKLQTQLKEINSGPVHVESLPPALVLSPLEPCAPCERLTLHLDPLTGTIYASCALSDLVPKTLERSLNTDFKAVSQDLQSFRHALVLRRCTNSVQHLGMTCTASIPLLPADALTTLCAPLVFVRLKRPPCHSYVVVELGHNPPESCNPEFRYYVLECSQSNVMSEPGGAKHVSLLLKPGFPLRIHADELLSHVSNRASDVKTSLVRKRKSTSDRGSPKRLCVSPDVLTELAALASLVEERVCLAALKQELERQGVRTQAITKDSGTSACVLETLQLPERTGCSTEASEALQRLLLSCRFRLLSKYTQGYYVEMLFRRPDLPSRELGSTEGVCRVQCKVGLPVPNRMSRVVADCLDDWASLGRMYQPVHQLIAASRKPDWPLAQHVTVKSFSFQKLVLAYGDKKSFTVALHWRTSDKLYQLTFSAQGGSHPLVAFSNPHQLVAAQLTAEFNANNDLVALCTTLVETLVPLQALSTLNTSLVYDLSKQDTKLPTMNFTVLPQTSRHLRVIYRSTYCLDVRVGSGSQVLLRDGGLSLFDHPAALEGIKPLQGVKAFLQQFAETNSAASSVGLQRRVSTVENDHPPSPIGRDPIDSLALQLQSPARRGVGVASPQVFNQLSPSLNLTSPSPATYGRSPGAGATAHGQPEGRRLPAGVSWAGGAPTLLSVEAFLRLVAAPTSGACGPLESFMAASMLRSQLARDVNSDKCALSLLRGDQPGVLSLRSEALAMRVQLKPQLHTLTLDVLHVNDKYKDMFTPEDLMTLKRYFEYKVASPPHRPVHMSAWATLLGAQPRVLKDLIEILKTELGQRRELSNLWQLSLCLSVPPDLPPDVLSGVPLGPAVVLAGLKLLLILKLSRSAQLAGPAAPAIVIPLIYEVENNVTRIPDTNRGPGIGQQQPLTPTLQVVAKVLRRFASDYRPNQCSLFPAVRELLLELPPAYTAQ